MAGFAVRINSVAAIVEPWSFITLPGTIMICGSIRQRLGQEIFKARFSSGSMDQSIPDCLPSRTKATDIIVFSDT